MVDNQITGTRRYRQIVIIVLVMAVMAIAGTVYILASHAATSSSSLEPEKGTLSGSVTAANDAAASGGAYVKFGPGGGGGTANSTTPCVGSAAPAVWKHVVVLMFENKSYNNVIGSTAPWITRMAQKCGSYTAWKDANYRVTGGNDGSYNSKPNYATLTSGVPPSVHGLTSDAYTTTSGVDNIFNRLNQAGKSAKDYVSGTGASCAQSNFSGAYHDAMRYYTNLGAQSSSPTSYCNTHDVSIDTFMTNVNNGSLPAFSFVLPTNDQNMHNNSIPSGDAWAQAFLVPLLDSAQYKSGDTAVFFLWDEDTPIPTVFLAPSIKPSTNPVPSGSLSFSHFSALRTWQEMLGISPLLGNTGQAPSLLNYYNGQ